MSIRIVCPNCHTAYNATDDQRGRRVRCRECQAIFRAAEPDDGASLAAVVEESESQGPAAGLAAAPVDSGKRHDRSSEQSPPRRKKAGRKIPFIALFLVIGGVGGSLFIVAASAVICVWLWNNPQETWSAAKSPDVRNPFPGGRNFAGQVPNFQVKQARDADGEDAAPQDADAQLQPEPPPPPKELDFASPLPQVADPPAPQGPANPQLPPDLVQKVKRATVYLRVTLANGQVSQGSGFFGVMPNIVLTNAHVVGMLRPESRPPRQVEVVLNSGAGDERQLSADVLGVDHDADLAVLRVAGQDVPPPLPVRSAGKLQETQQVYVFGFPFGAGLGKEITVSQSSVSSLRSGKVQINGGMQPGNSGGPVVDAYGNVVGVAVSAIRFTPINFAVPGDKVYAFLQGRVSRLSIGLPYRKDTQIKAPVTMTMIDPLGQVRGTAIEIWTGDPAAAPRQPATLQPALQAGDSPHQRQPLQYHLQAARGDVVLPPLPPGKVYWVQPTWMNPAGESRWATANVYPLPPPVERKPVLLALRHQVGSRPVVLSSWLDLKALFGDGSEHTWTARAQTSLTETTEAVDAQELANVRLQYLAYNEKLSGDNQDVHQRDIPQALHNIKTLAANLRIDKQGNLVGNEVDVSRVPVESQGVLSNVHEALEQALGSLAIPLPNRQVLPGESWKAERTIGLHSPVRTISVHLDMTYTYAGSRKRAGHEEAVIELEGKIRTLGNQGGRGTGRADGAANVDLATGQVTQADMALVFDVEMNPLSRSLPSNGKLTLQLRRDVPGNAGN